MARPVIKTTPETRRECFEVMAGIMNKSDAYWIDHRGCRLFCRVQGHGPPVLLIQGVGVHGDGWEPQVRALATRYRCATFDNRGMGQSQPTGSADISVPQMAQDALAVMDSCGWTSAHLIGHSLGGLIAQHVALIARNRVRSLSLLCTFPRGRDATKLSGAMIWTGIRMRLGTRRQRRRAFLELVMPPNAKAKLSDEMAQRLAPLFGHDLAEQPAIVMKQLAALKGYDATPRLAELAGLPTLVVSASYDRIAPVASGRALAAALPGAAFIELPEAAHGVPLEQPERINALLWEHLLRSEAAATQTGTLNPLST